ncbi:hypothetical protein [Brevundimonas sp. GCM10030266]|uniref:hypothetical protein n=1 Tax=Brevundimonas sp. GCM10030266 TaxID=3273386 RepID=UPI003620ECEA
MRIGGLVMAAALTGIGLTGCATARYPTMTGPSPTELAGMTCAQLAAEQAVVDRTERQIAEIAANGRAADGSSPVLYSTARADADRAIQTRRAALSEAAAARGCSR